MVPVDQQSNYFVNILLKEISGSCLASKDVSPLEISAQVKRVFDPFAAVELAAWILRHYQVIIYLSLHAYDWQIKYTTDQFQFSARSRGFFSLRLCGFYTLHFHIDVDNTRLLVK